MKQKKDLLILSHLRKDARKSLVALSKETGIPASTIYDRVNAHEKDVIKKYTALLDFKKLGYHGRVYVAIRLNDFEKRKELLEFLLNQKCINSLYRINLDYHYMFEAVFESLGEAESFVHEIEEKFGIDETNIFSVVEDIKREEFLTKPEHFGAEK